jgi:hypothetical protein
MPARNRRDTRYSIRFPAQLTMGRRTFSLLTEDVSLGGVFLGTDEPPPLHQLVSVQLVLPIGDHALRAHGMTVHVVAPGGSRDKVLGIGVQFYALDQATRESWETFVRHVEESYPESKDQTPLRLPRGITPQPIRRRFERHTAVLRVEPASQTELVRLYDEEISTGRLALTSRMELAPGTRVLVHVAHPTTGKPFLIEALVEERTLAPPGLRVGLLGTDHAFKEAFLDYVRGGISIDDEVVLPSSDALPPSSSPTGGALPR